MILRSTFLKRTSHASPCFTQLHPSSRTALAASQQCHRYPLSAHSNSRYLHHRMETLPPPQPTPFIPDANTFLKVIGRSLSQYASKIPSWSALFNLTAPQLKELGIERARDRRYLLRWRDKFRRGDWGVGGDLKYVDEEGSGLVSIVDIPRAEAPSPPVSPLNSSSQRSEAAAATQAIDMNLDAEAASAASATPFETATMTRSPGTRRIVINVKPDTPTISTPPLLSSSTSSASGPESAAPAATEEPFRPVAFLKIRGSSQIYGPYVEQVKGSGGKMAKIKVKEGMWEHSRGVKIDGGERRQAEVRAKRRAAQRKAQRA